MKILLAGDLCPIGYYENTFAQNLDILKKKREVWANYDYRLVNLECPLVDEPSPVVKGGPCLRVKTAVGHGIKNLGVDGVTLANNHILDQGDVGLFSTIKTLDANGIDHFGAGANVAEASRSFCLERDGEKIHFLAFAEKEYNYATGVTAGANPFECVHVIREINKLPKNELKCVIIHGGNEFYRLPNPMLRDFCHLLIELGVDLVVCHHTHCFCASEQYQKGTIFYGLGNFLFDRPFCRKSLIRRTLRFYPGEDFWSRGLLLSVEVKNNKILSTEILPHRQNGPETLFSLLEGEEKEAFQKEYAELNVALQNEQEYYKRWLEFCARNKILYKSLLFDYFRYLYLFGKTRIDVSRFFQSAWGRRNIGNTLRCASHLEVAKTLFARWKNE